MDLSIRSEVFQQENQQWLGSAEGAEEPRTVTLDVSTFTAGTHYPNGYIPSGTALGKITASGKYGVYDNTTPATDGRQTFVGFLLDSMKVGATNTVPIVAAMCDIGRIVVAKLPFSSGAGSIDSAAKTAAAGSFQWV